MGAPFPFHVSASAASKSPGMPRPPKVVDRPPPPRAQKGGGAAQTAHTHPLPPQALGNLGAVGEGEGSAHQIAALTIWLRQHGVDFTDRAQFVRVRGMGIGGISTRAFDEGDVIFSLPLAAPKRPLNRFGNRVEETDEMNDENDAESGTETREPPSLSPLVLTTSAVSYVAG